MSQKITVEFTQDEAEAAVGAFIYMSNKTGGRATARGSVEARTWDKIAHAAQAAEAEASAQAEALIAEYRAEKAQERGESS